MENRERIFKSMSLTNIKKKIIDKINNIAFIKRTYKHLTKLSIVQFNYSIIQNNFS